MHSLAAESALPRTEPLDGAAALADAHEESASDLDGAPGEAEA